MGSRYKFLSFFILEVTKVLLIECFVIMLEGYNCNPAWVIDLWNAI